MTNEWCKKLEDAACLELGRLMLAGWYYMVEVQPHGNETFLPSVEMTFEESNVDEIVASVLRVGQQHRQHLDALAAALQAGDLVLLRNAAQTLVGGTV